MMYYHQHSFAKSTLFIIENKSHIKMLNNTGPKMEPWRTPKMISSYELYVVFIFVLCFLGKKGGISFSFIYRLYQAILYTEILPKATMKF